MARSPFGPRDFGNTASQQLPAGSVGAPAAGAAAGVGAAVQGFARELGQIADRKLTREGQTDAMRAVTAARDFGLEPQLRQGSRVDDQAYNTVVRQSLALDMGKAFRAAVAEAEVAHPADPLAFAEAVQAARAPFAERFQQDPELFVAFERDAATVSGAALGRVRAGHEAQRRDIVQSSYMAAATEGETRLGQVIVGAGFDDEGVELVTRALWAHATDLARFGPREAFSIGGVEFEADPTRAGVISASQLAQSYDQLQVRTRTTWLVDAVSRAPSAQAAQQLVEGLRERYAAGSPAFAGIGPAEMAQINNRLDATVSRKATNEEAARNAAAASLADWLEAAEYGGAYDAEHLRQLAAASGDPGLASRVEFGLTHGFDVTPASLRSGSGGRRGAAGFDAWVEFLLDDLEGPGVVADDNGAGSSQWGITRRSHPEAWADGKIDRQEAIRIYRDYWRDVGGDSLPPALAAAAASFAVVAGAGAARRALDAAGGDLDRFYAQERAHYVRLAENGNGKYLEGWLARLDKSRNFALGIVAEERASEGYSTNPIGYARSRDMADVPEMDLNSIFGADPQGTGDFLRNRLALGRQLAQRSGVPVAIFDTAELRTIKDRIEDNPAALVSLVTTAATTQGVGPDGARVILGQLGRAGTATADLQLGWLAVTPTTRNLAAKVIQGRALRAEGSRDVTWPGEQSSIADVVNSYAAVFAMQPELNPAVQALAADMAIADAARGQLKSAATYVNSALGGANSGGTRYGGLARVNDAPTIAPTWLRHDMLDDALELAAGLWEQENKGPLYSNGTPIPARVLRTYTLRAAPNGRYRLITPDGAQVAARSGAAFEFNIEGLRAHMARNHPGSVLQGGR